MPSFPILSSGTTLQYNAEIQQRFRTDLRQFLNNDEQAYIDVATPKKAWIVKLSLLNSIEIAALRAFFEQVQGRFETFSYTDPADGTVYPSCALLTDNFEISQDDETFFSGNLTIYSVVRLS